MSNLVKQSQLSEVSLELWRRIKNRYNGAFINARYEEATQKLILTPVEGAEVEVELTDLASKTLDNIFTGKNTFNDLTLGLPNKVVDSNIPTNLWGVLNNPIKTGNRKISSHAVPTSSGIVKNLVIRVEQVQPGDKANVNVWEVTKGADRSQDVPKLLHSNIEVDVIPKDGYFNGGNAIKCPINKKYDKDTYFIFQLLGNAKVFRAASINPPSDDYVVIEENVDVTTQNIVGASRDEVGVQLLELGDVNIADLVSSSSGTGTVTTVNNQLPDVSGNVTVNAEHINTQAGITVQEALDNKVDTATLADYITEAEADRRYVPQAQVGNAPNLIPQLNQEGKLVSSIIPELSITRVLTVADEAEALGKIGDDTENGLQTGDVVVIEQNNNSVYMYNGTGTQVFNDNFIELSIGDGTIKVINSQRPALNGEVIVKAEHTPYNSQTSNLVANNVQAAIDELDGKFVENITYVEATRELQQTKNGATTRIVDGLVTQWKDLDYVKQFTNINILDYSKVKKNTSLNNSFEYANDASGEWGVVEFPVTEGEQYTLLRQRQYHVRIRFEDNGGTKVGHVDSPAPSNKNWHRCVFNAPVGSTKGVLEVRVTQSNEKDVMILAGDQTNLTVDVNNPIPFFDNKFLQIGKEMSYAFDNSNSNIKSTTVESAIKELDSKITNAGTGNGTVTKVNGQLPNNQGEVSVPAVMSIAMNAQDKKKIDVVTYDNIQSQVDLTETLKSTNITYDGDIGGIPQPTVNEALGAIDNKLSSSLTTINNVGATGGNIDLTFTNNSTTSGGNITFNVGNTNILTLDYMTEQEANDIIDSFIF